LNPETRISSGANEALRHIDRGFFVSIEQDVVLAKEWWNKIPPHMENPEVAVAQGIRLSTNPTLRKMDEYQYDRMKLESKGITYGISIDNNIYRTRAIKAIGGFPYDCPVCVDSVLMQKLHRLNFKWIVDKSIVSTHLRDSVIGYIKHHYKMTKLCSGSEYCLFPKSAKHQTLLMLRIFLTSPARATLLAYKKKSFKLFCVYPIVRLALLAATVDKKLSELLW